MTSESQCSAVVLGASMGGLLAARALSEFYRTVTVVERDHLPECPVSRRGVPQDKHPHNLPGRGFKIVNELFPDLFDELEALGALKWDDGDLSKHWAEFGGHLMARSKIVQSDPMITYHGSRPLLEFGVRRAMQKIPNVAFLDEHDFVGLVPDPDRRQITGVRIATQRGDETVLSADLVVDATGRGSRSPTFLRDLGYDRPPVDEVEVRIAYATLPVRIARGTLHELFAAVLPVPERPKIFIILACEQDTYLVLGGTVGGQEPPADRDELLDFIADFAPRHVVAAVRAAEPLGKVSQYRIPSNRWRRYDKLARMPTGLLVFGDAICSFNPIYGQGITIAAIEAEILRGCLTRGVRDLTPRFYRQSGKAIRTAWRTAVSSDLALPQVPGRRPLSMRLTNAFIDRVLTATETDAVVAGQFLRVIWMLDSMMTLLRPSIVLRVAKALHKQNSKPRIGA